jgi:hypothetical protein
MVRIDELAAENLRVLVAANLEVRHALEPE